MLFLLFLKHFTLSTRCHSTIYIWINKNIIYQNTKYRFEMHFCIFTNFTSFQYIFIYSTQAANPNGYCGVFLLNFIGKLIKIISGQKLYILFPQQLFLTTIQIILNISIVHPQSHCTRTCITHLTPFILTLWQFH